MQARKSIETLEKQGYIILPNLITDTKTAKLATELDQWFDKDGVMIKYMSRENMKAAAIKGNILEDVNDLDKMITELLESERMNSTHGGLNKNNIALNNLIKEVAMQYSKVTLIMNSDDIKINADKERLRLLFKNLIENAIKY